MIINWRCIKLLDFDDALFFSAALREVLLFFLNFVEGSKDVGPVPDAGPLVTSLLKKTAFGLVGAVFV